MTIRHRKRTLPAATKLVRLVADSLDDDKAQDVVVIDLTGRTTIADFMIVASGTSQRHVGAMAEHLERKLKAQGLARLSIEGMPQREWVLIDAGDVVVHLFRPEVRTFYDLEKMWAVVPAAGPRAAGMPA